MMSWSAKVLAVRRVTQDNQGKKTAGVDGVKSLTPKQRLQLVSQLRLTSKAKPVRRVWIDKPGKTEKRPLGIPTMNDRATQALVKAALEPEWEAKFEPNSYGFRPGRSCHDAIEAIFGAIKQKPKYVLDADIARCFDCINHDALLIKLNTTPTIRRQIKAWLKAGVIDWSANGTRDKKKVFSQTHKGTPQGGVLSPLLANIALHGLENRLLQYVETIDMKNNYGRQQSKKSKRMTLAVIRYADDFVILHKDKSVVQRCQQITADWLKGIGLELKPEKTRLSHTLIEEEGNIGFNFLGFNIRQFQVGEYSSKQGFKTIITPDKENLKVHTKIIGDLIDRHKGSSREALIATLNPVVRGWSNYYKTVCSKELFQLADHITYQQIRGWAIYRHENVNKTWTTKGNNHWVFATKDGQHWLTKHSDTVISRHIKVKDSRSPFDGDWVYWSTRKGDYPETPKQLS
jgi:RNA-directed DNA polymerase